MSAPENINNHTLLVVVLNNDLVFFLFTHDRNFQLIRTNQFANISDSDLDDLAREVVADNDQIGPY